MSKNTWIERIATVITEQGKVTATPRAGGLRITRRGYNAEWVAVGIGNPPADSARAAAKLTVYADGAYAVTVGELAKFGTMQHDAAGLAFFLQNLLTPDAVANARQIELLSALPREYAADAMPHAAREEWRVYVPFRRYSRPHFDRRSILAVRDTYTENGTRLKSFPYRPDMTLPDGAPAFVREFMRAYRNEQ